MSGIDEQYRCKNTISLEEKEIERQIAERMLRTMKYCLTIHGEDNSLNGFLSKNIQQSNIVSELTEYYRNVKLNKELPVYE